jgi:DNA repair protein RadC
MGTAATPTIIAPPAVGRAKHLSTAVNQTNWQLYPPAGGAAAFIRLNVHLPRNRNDRKPSEAARILFHVTIRRWPDGERPRERLLERGAHALSDAELLAVLLGSGIKGQSAVELARTLIAEFGSLRKLLSAEASRCLAQSGIGPARYAILKAAVELARRHFREALLVGPALAAPDATRTFLLAQLRDRPYEVFCCLYLDNRHRLIAFEELFRGTIDRAGVHPREVLRQTLMHNAAAVILAHNHPSGVLEPSQADELITRRLKEALALVDVRVLDHFIIGDGQCYSFAEHGLM